METHFLPFKPPEEEVGLTLLHWLPGPIRVLFLPMKPHSSCRSYVSWPNPRHRQGWGSLGPGWEDSFRFPLQVS